VVAGGLVLVSGRPVFDSLVALVIAAVIVITTVRSVLGSREELLWPENVVCGHE
jgi:divalent metal cation (Fe/Co/Zn/Cd) transporter